MHAAYLPDWMYGLAPPLWWPAAARDFFGYTLTMLDLQPSGFAGGRVTRSVAFSKRLDALVFGGKYLETTTDDLTAIQPATGTGSCLLVQLGNPAGADVYSSDPVPIENLFGGAALGSGTVGTRPFSMGQPAVWPIPIPVRRGSELLVTVQNTNAGGAATRNLRITFYVALIGVQGKAA